MKKVSIKSLSISFILMLFLRSRSKFLSQTLSLSFMPREGNKQKHGIILQQTKEPAGLKTLSQRFHYNCSGCAILPLYSPKYASKINSFSLCPSLRSRGKG